MLYPVLTAVVSEGSYQVGETEEYVSACVNISGGDLARPVRVAVMTLFHCGQAILELFLIDSA